MNRTQREKDLWDLLWLDMLVAVISLTAIILNWSIVKNPYLQTLAGLFPVALIVLHAVWTLGLRRGLGFFAWMAATGLVFEILGLKYLIFGQYRYQAGQASVFGVPVMIVLFWAVFIYVGYAVTNSFLFWLNLKKPNFRNKNLLLLISLVLADGIAVTAIDLFMDPLQVRLGSWAWPGGGWYFGVPARNFLGWFLVAMVATGSFRLFEYFHPRGLKAVSKKVFLIPLLGYAFLAGCFIFLALAFHMESLAVCGSVLMLAIAALNFRFYEQRSWLRKL
jgi:putative membrane protein